MTVNPIGRSGGIASGDRRTYGKDGRSLISSVRPSYEDITTRGAPPILQKLPPRIDQYPVPAPRASRRTLADDERVWQAVEVRVARDEAGIVATRGRIDHRISHGQAMREREVRRLEGQ